MIKWIRNPKWRMILLVFGVLIFGSCKTTKEIKNVEAESFELEDALLWQIDSRELEEPSYLFGTIHMIESEHFFWPSGTLTALDDAEQIAFEVDLDDMFDLSSQMGLLTKAFMGDGKKLSDFYSEADYKLIRSHFEDIGLPMFFLERIKPMFLTVFASGDIDLGVELSDQSSIKSYEMELYQISQDSDMEVEGLETMEFQMSVFDSIPYQAQADMLLETILSSDTENDAFQEMIQMYKDQDINKMVSSMSEEGGIEGYEDLLLYQRNKNWIPIMSEKMKLNQMFFAVGAGHLGGENGVIDLLRKAGYKLTPLSQNNSI